MKNLPQEPRVIVVGGGAAGLAAAGAAAELGARVLLLEKTDALGKKLLLSGKGRCNLTNAKPREEFILMYGPNGPFLYRAFHTFFRDDLIALLKRYGLEVKTERGGRIFPATEKAADVVRAWARHLEKNRVEIRLSTRVTSLDIRDGRIAGVVTPEGLLTAEAVILATGGASFPATGSSGDGYHLAKTAGHEIVPPRPALVPLLVEEKELAASMQGVTLKNIRLTTFRGKADKIDALLAPTYDVGRGCGGSKPHPTVIESRLGEMMFTHFGLGGPVVLLASLAVVDALKEGPVSAAIDFKPALSRELLDGRLQRDLAAHGKRTSKSILAGLVPQKLIVPLAGLAHLALDKPASQITSRERARLASLLKGLKFNIRDSLPLEWAIVTAGGVNLRQVDPYRMESLLVKGLYLGGELLDVDADTGGYNLQAAFSTGHLAGVSAARQLHEGF